MSQRVHAERRRREWPTMTVTGRRTAVWNGNAVDGDTIGADSTPRFWLERMPFEATPLTPNQNIARWIDQGARRN